MDSTLRPRDIQARIRAGESPEAVAEAARTTVDKIAGFANPVLAERAHIADRAQKASVRRRAGDGPSAARRGRRRPAGRRDLDPGASSGTPGDARTAGGRWSPTTAPANGTARASSSSTQPAGTSWPRTTRRAGWSASAARGPRPDRRRPPRVPTCRRRGAPAGRGRDRAGHGDRPEDADRRHGADTVGHTRGHPGRRQHGRGRLVESGEGRAGGERAEGPTGPQRHRGRGAGHRPVSGGEGGTGDADWIATQASEPSRGPRGGPRRRRHRKPTPPTTPRTQPTGPPRAGCGRCRGPSRPRSPTSRPRRPPHRAARHARRAAGPRCRAGTRSCSAAADASSRSDDRHRPPRRRRLDT